MGTEYTLDYCMFEVGCLTLIDLWFQPWLRPSGQWFRPKITKSFMLAVQRFVGPFGLPLR